MTGASGSMGVEERPDWGSYDRVLQALTQYQRVAVFLHQNPDGDSVGSSLALGLALSHLGKQVSLIYDRNFPKVYRYLAGSDRFVHWKQVSAESFDAALMPDLAGADRLGDAKPLADAIPIWINCDHHPTNPGFGDVRWVDPTRSCVGEMAYELVQGLQVPLSLPMAEAIYTAILTDSGSFCFESTTALTHTYAGELLRAGVRPERIAQSVYESRSLASLRLLGKALTGIRVDAGGHLAWLSISQENLKEAGAHPGEMEGLVNYARGLEGVEMGVLFFEEDRGTIRVGLRSKQYADVGSLAERFGGGGHIRAAGCTLEGPLLQARERVLKAAREMLAALPVAATSEAPVIRAPEAGGARS
ncbi:MAG: bifunctional oligoribonuclease/PAP phosphatase NrnA [Thermaerobacterales bacterium]